MSTESNISLLTFPASGDLSASQDCFVSTDTAGRVAVTGDGALAQGVLKNNPTAIDTAAVVMTVPGQKVKVLCSGSFSIGDRVSSDANGKANLAATGDYVLGIAQEAGANGSRVQILFQPSIKR